MKSLIKIFFALCFILGSYFLGYYQAEEKCSFQLNETNKILTSRQSRIHLLKDSISKISKLLNTNLRQRDSLKMQADHQKKISKHKLLGRS